MGDGATAEAFWSPETRKMLSAIDAIHQYHLNGTPAIVSHPNGREGASRILQAAAAADTIEDEALAAAAMTAMRMTSQTMRMVCASASPVRVLRASPHSGGM